MPKKDNFAAAQKDNAKARQKINNEKKTEAKKSEEAAAAAAAEEAEAAAAAKAAKAAAGRKGLATPATNTTFTKAAAADDAEEDYDYDHGGAEEDAPAASSAPTKSKKEEKKDAKKSKASQKKDDFAVLAEQEQLAKKQRIKQRFLNMMIVGVVMDMFSGKDTSSNGNTSAGKEKKEKKPKKNASNDEANFSVRSVKEKVELYSGPLMVSVIIAAVLWGKMMEDAYSPAFNADENFYDVMGLPRDAGIIDIRRKYKNLALSWHPDKNPDCEACPEKFAGIQKAYETLSNPEAKQAYDNKKAAAGSLNSRISTDLTADDFEAKVLRSNEVWVVEVYDPNDETSKGFHPIWEELSSTMQHVARFGRIDASKQKKALSFLPQRVVIMPVIFRFARGHYPADYMYQGRSEVEETIAPVKRFVLENFPDMPFASGTSAISRWWKRVDRPRLLITGSGSVIQRGAQHKEFVQVVKETHLWSEFFDINSADSREAVEALKDIKWPEEVQKKNNKVWTVTWRPAGVADDSKAVTQSTDNVKELPALITEVVQKALISEAPHLTVRNHHQLCDASISRTYCLVIVDMPDDQQVAKVLTDLAASRAEYAKEVEEARDTDAEVTEEPFRIQPVRVMTSTSRFPSKPVAVGSAFYSAWSEVGKSSMFLVEMETQRVAAVKASSLNQICQQVAYEDIKFKELPEGFSIARGLPDPEVPFQRQVLRVVTSPLGGLITYILLAAAAALAPELELVTNAAAAGAFVAVVVLVWPLACRRFLSMLMLG